MTDAEVKRPSGTVWIVLGAIGLAIGLLHLVTAPMVILAANGDAATISGKIVGVLLFAGTGVSLLVVGLNQRRRHLQR